MKRGYQESSSSGSLRPSQSKIRHNPEGDAHFLEDESTKVFARKVADHYSAIIHLKKLNNCVCLSISSNSLFSLESMIHEVLTIEVINFLFILFIFYFFLFMLL